MEFCRQIGAVTSRASSIDVECLRDNPGLSSLPPFPCSIMHGPALGSLEEALPCAVTKPLALGFAQKQFM